jgi:hypothetical protein
MKTICTGFMKVDGIRKIAGEKAPIVVERAEEVVAAVINGRAEWRVMQENEKKREFTSGDVRDTADNLVEKATSGEVDALPSAGTEMMVVDEPVVLSKPATPYDATGLWEGIPQAVKSSKTTTPKPAGSSLFGKTLTSRTVATTIPTPPAGTSSLFGKTIIKSIPNVAEGSKSNFHDVLKGINDSIAPVKAVPPPSPVAQPKKNTLPEVETVPFIPTASRSTLPSSPPAPPPKPLEKEKPRDAIVQVKKSKGKSKAAPPPTSVNGVETETPAPAKKAKKTKSTPKVAEGEIAEFDYSTAPNLLDNPHSGVEADRGKKKSRNRKPKGSGE